MIRYATAATAKVWVDSIEEHTYYAVLSGVDEDDTVRVGEVLYAEPLMRHWELL
jgi:hypothetical protein